MRAIAHEWADSPRNPLHLAYSFVQNCISSSPNALYLLDAHNFAINPRTSPAAPGCRRRVDACLPLAARPASLRRIRGPRSLIARLLPSPRQAPLQYDDGDDGNARRLQRPCIDNSALPALSSRGCARPHRHRVLHRAAVALYRDSPRPSAARARSTQRSSPRHRLAIHARPSRSPRLSAHNLSQ